MKDKYSKAITERFVSVMKEVIAANKKKKGEIRSIKKFAKSIGQYPQNLSNFSNSRDQNVTLKIIEPACRIYRINPTFLILGIGERFLNGHSATIGQSIADTTTSDSGARLNRLMLLEHEERIQRLEKLIK